MWRSDNSVNLNTSLVVDPQGMGGGTYITLFSPSSHLKGFPVTSLRFTELIDRFHFQFQSISNLSKVGDDRSYPYDCLWCLEFTNARRFGPFPTRPPYQLGPFPTRPLGFTGPAPMTIIYSSTRVNEFRAFIIVVSLCQSC